MLRDGSLAGQKRRFGFESSFKVSQFYLIFQIKQPAPIASGFAIPNGEP